MSDIFISYARPDRAQVERLSDALEAEGMNVWWDRHIEAGHEFARDIEAHLEAARAVLVCWSSDGSASHWVKDEASIAAESGKLVAVSLDGTPPPLGFRQYHALPLDDWAGGRDEGEFVELLHAIRHRLDPETPPLQRAQPRARPKRRLQRPLVAGLAILLVAALALFAFQTWSGSRGDEAQSLPALPEEQTSIAVLAFEDLSQDGDQQFFADGISEEILNVLARVDGLRVASRTSAFRFRDGDQPIPAIAEALGVRHIVEGSVRTSGDRIRVTAQLIDGQTDQHLWSQTFDRDLTTQDLFEIEDEIAKSIVAQLGRNLDLGSTEAIRFFAAAETDNVAAYEAFLKARARFNDRSVLGEYDEVIALYEKAVELDPDFAHAWIGLSSALSVAEGYLPEATYRARDFPALARNAAQRGIDLSPDLSSGYTAMSNVLLMERYSADAMEESMALLNHALTLDPRDSLALNWRGQLAGTLGHFDDAIADGERAVALDPSDTVAWALISITHLYRDDVDAALDAIDRGKLETGVVIPLVALASAREGREDNVERLFARFAQAPPEIPAILRRLAKEEPLTDAQLNLFLGRRGAVDPPAVEQLDSFSLYIISRFDLLDDMRHGTFPIYWLRIFPRWLDHPNRYAHMREMELDLYWKRNGYPAQCRPIDPLPDGRDFACD